MKGKRDKRMTNSVQIVRNNTKTKRELVLEKESTMRISKKRKGVCKTHRRERE